MSKETKTADGSILWFDLTVKNAEQLRDFYSEVADWKAEPLSMGDYDDFVMNSAKTGETIAGICHARGGNANLPPQWLLYISVKDVDKSVERCVSLGGRVISGPKDMGSHGRYCVIQDPAGAVAALITPA